MKAIRLISKDNGKKSATIEVEFDGKTKQIKLTKIDTNDQAEVFRAMTRELAKYEKSLKVV